MIETEYLKFEQIPKASRKRKLPSWYVYAKTNWLPIGEIVWKFIWRRYVFEPYVETQWDSNCLSEIAVFMASQTLTEGTRMLGKKIVEAKQSEQP